MKLSTTYRTLAGDTFELIARRVYGTEQQAQRIRAANPGATEPFSAGVTLTAPALPGAPSESPGPAPANSLEEVALNIEGERFRFWESIKVTRAIDAMDTLQLSAPFDAKDAAFRKTFRPFSYKSTDVIVGGVPLFTGTMVGVNPSVGVTRKTLNVSAYSLPGVLNDCTAPASAFPLEFNGQNLRDIATTIATFFGLAVAFDIDPGPVFERVALAPGKKVLGFLSGLAKQRNLIVSSTPAGAVLFLRPEAGGVPRAHLQQGQSPFLSATPFFSPQEYYSHVTGLEPVLVGLGGSQFTVKNPRLAGVVRPITFEAPDTAAADVKAAVEAKAGRMFGNAASYSVGVSTWRDPAGKLWEPNSTITLTAPDAMVYQAYDFTIRSVEFDRAARAESATLNLVIPGAFSGQVPGGLPWDG